MGIYDRPYYRDDSDSSFLGSHRTMIANLVIINVAVYLVDMLFSGGRGAADHLVWKWLSATSHVPWGDSVRNTLTQPWTWWQFLTYGFAHDPKSAFHLIGNMLALFFLGTEIELLYGRRLFLKMYLSALVVCALVWAIIAELTHRPAMLIGASGAVTAVVMLFALNFPQRRIMLFMFIPAPAWALGVLVIAGNLWGMRTLTPVGEARVAYDVHLIGAAYAYLFFRTQWTLASPFPSLDRFRRLMPGGRPRLRIHPESTDRWQSLDAEADEVLAKLHREGEASLTARERRVLEEYSRKMQQKYR